MYKKCIPFILVLCMLLPCLPATAKIYADVCPVNVEYEVSYHNQTDPVLLAFFSNATDVPITYLEFHVYLYDALYRETYGITGHSNRFDGCTVNWQLDEYEISDDLYWELNDFPLAVYANGFVVEKVRFQDGSVWSAPEDPLYQEALGFILNDRMPDGSYILQNDNSLLFLDNSFSSTQRTWYIWSDAAGNWVWFSNQLVDKCYIWAPQATIKLVINNDPACYWIKSVTVVSPPSTVAATVYNTGQSLSLSPVEEMDDVSATVQMSGNTRPCTIALWDTNNANVGREWYIWDDTSESWNLFSTERGPICQIWQKGTAHIALRYNGQEDLAMYTIAFSPTLLRQSASS